MTTENKGKVLRYGRFSVNLVGVAAIITAISGLWVKQNEAEEKEAKIQESTIAVMSYRLDRLEQQVATLFPEKALIIPRMDSKPMLKESLALALTDVVKSSQHIAGGPHGKLPMDYRTIQAYVQTTGKAWSLSVGDTHGKDGGSD